MMKYLYYVTWNDYYGEFRYEFVIATNGYEAQQFAMNRTMEQYWRCKNINVQRLNSADGFEIKVKEKSNGR